MKNVNLTLPALLILCCVFAACWSDDSKSKSRDDKKTTPTATPESNVNSAASENKSDNSTNTKMSDASNTEVKSGGFSANLPAGFKQPTDAVGQRLLKEYGALFVARGGAIPPNTVIFKDAAEVSAFQNGLSKSKEKIGNFDVELQSAAMKNLQDAIAEAKQSNLTITPRGADSAKRDYAGTVDLWASRVNPGLAHYVGNGKLSQSEADRIKALSPFEQVPEIFKLESNGMYFSKDLSKSIIYSVAPPGTSQHLSMIALDVGENETPKVRDILAKHGWFQTVVSDLPHFTFLGVQENQLTGLGLKKVSDGGRTFWLPNL
ncbi:MAG: hypothetical protein ACR2HG_12870 [Pyrinomonadaceae bacterium]